ncbi:MAG: hypothetical protein KDA65_09300 [Planctomycetaceae bacterium]|nr:hypothetical protein [Planctomycetaceae bacterium]
MDKYEEHLAICKQMFDRGVLNEEMLTWLRSQGAGKIESIKIIRELYEIRLGEAKYMVHTSEAWEDRRAADDQFHEELIDVFEQICRDEREAEG